MRREVTSDKSATMAQVIGGLQGLLSDNGIALWLVTSVKALGDRRPIDLCLTPDGRYRVWALSEAMKDGVFL